MIPLSLLEIRDLVGGTLAGLSEADAASTVIDGPVVTDSRQAGPGGLYVARVGEHADGHDFVADAAARGAAAALTTRAVNGFPCVVVNDVQDAFAGLARAVVDRRPDLFVVGITGSSGKTSTKDLLAAVLGARGETVAPEGSLNSEVGVPLTVLRVTPATRHLIVEMGARGQGHIRYLTQIAPPRVGVVLNVGTAHLGEFGSREAIATAKSELVQALPTDGLAVLNADDAVVAAMASVTRARTVLVGQSPEADLRADQITLDDQGRPRFVLHDETEQVQVRLRLVGKHHVSNALAVAAVAREAGMNLPEIAAALRRAEPASRWRMEVTRRPDHVVIVNDAYNANPDSMRAALAATEAIRTPGRHLAVLGAMYELGPDSDTEHAGVGAAAVSHGMDVLLVVGDEANQIARGARDALATRDESGTTEVVLAPDADAAYEWLIDHCRPDDVVLLKSSRDAGLRWLGQRLVEGTPLDTDKLDLKELSP